MGKQDNIITKEDAKRLKIQMCPIGLHGMLDLSDEANQKFADWLNTPLIDILKKDANS